MALNKVIMVGRLTQDPELKQTNTGVEVTRFGIAIQMATNKTEFFDVVAWRKTAGFIARFFRKGDGICIDGYLSTRTHEKDGVAHKVYEVICDSAGFAEERVARVKALGEVTERARACRYSWLERNPRAFNSNPEGVCKILYRVLFDKDHLGKKYNGISKEALAALGSTEDNIDHEVPAVAIGRILLAWLDNDNAPYRSWDGEYNESRALNAVYDLLAYAGYAPSTEEVELLNGTSPLYGGDGNDDE